MTSTFVVVQCLVLRVTYYQRQRRKRIFLTWGRTHIWYRPDRNTQYCP